MKSGRINQSVRAGSMSRKDENKILAYPEEWEYNVSD